MGPAISRRAHDRFRRSAVAGPNAPDRLFAVIRRPRLITRPTWLSHAHAALDRAVGAAYAWDDADLAAIPDETILERLLALNTKRSELPPMLGIEM